MSEAFTEVRIRQFELLPNTDTPIDILVSILCYDGESWAIDDIEVNVGSVTDDARAKFTPITDRHICAAIKARLQDDLDFIRQADMAHFDLFAARADRYADQRREYGL